MCLLVLCCPLPHRPTKTMGPNTCPTQTLNTHIQGHNGTIGAADQYPMRLVLCIPPTTTMSPNTRRIPILKNYWETGGHVHCAMDCTDGQATRPWRIKRYTQRRAEEKPYSHRVTYFPNRVHQPTMGKPAEGNRSCHLEISTHIQVHKATQGEVGP